MIYADIMFSALYSQYLTKEDLEWLLWNDTLVHEGHELIDGVDMCWVKLKEIR